MTFTEWEAGTLTDIHAIRSLAMDLAEVESELAPLEKQRQQLRDELSRVLAHAGGKAEIAGFGQLTMTAPSITTSYDQRRLDDLVLSLIADGYSDIAESIAGCRKQSARSGALRIVREKEPTNGRL